MREKIRDVLIVVGWAAGLVLITLNILRARAHYVNINLSELEMLLYFAVSMIAGMFLTDLRKIVFGYIATFSLSILTVLIYSSLFYWFVLGYREFLSDFPFGWEYVVQIALSNIIRVMFPIVILICFVAVFIGGFLGEHLKKA